MDAVDRSSRVTALGNAAEAIKDAHYGGLDALQPGLGQKLATANGDYAEGVPVYKQAAGVLKGAPETYATKFLKKGSTFAAGLKSELGPDYRLVQDAGANEMMRQSLDNNGNLSLPALQRNYNKSYRNADWRPDQRQVIENTIHMMKAAGLS